MDREVFCAANAIRQIAAIISCDIDCNCQCCQILFNEFVIQSGEEEVIRESTNNSTADQINVGFEDAANGEQSESYKAPLWYTPTTQKQTDLNDYLRRPVQILSDTWAVGASKTDADTFQPWYLYFNHASIKKKVDNYAFIRCDLHLKVMINASPFYYSSLCFSYQPLSSVYNSAPVSGSAPYTIPLSQRPSVWLYPQDGESKELILPYLSNTEWLTLGSASALQNFGEVTYFSPQTLANCNGSTANISIQVYAWAENVQLSGLTVDLSVQAEDEYVADGPISKPASAVARAAGMLTSLPYIGPYMTATSYLADKTADIAKLFGYSKVPVVDDTKPYKNLPFHGLAVSDISDATEKLTVDSKNELTINNTCIGDPCSDNLLINTWVQRNSFYDDFTWQSTDVSGTLLYNVYVHPMVGRYTTQTYQYVHSFTPVAIPAMCFEYWRGDMIYDFKIVCSKYHKGRLRFSWDPVGDVANTADSLTEVYNQVVDITETTYVSIRVPYNQRVAYLKTPASLRTTVASISPLAKDSSDTINGILTVRVLNEQTSPITSADITINMFVRGAENLEFACPKEVDSGVNFYTVQSYDEELTMGELSNTDPNINTVYMGEKVSSLRELLMRTNYHRYMKQTLDANMNLERFRFSRRPLFPGFDVNGAYSATSLSSSGAKNYNLVKVTPYHIISSCFLGERGAYTWKVDCNSMIASDQSISRRESILTDAGYLTSINSISIDGSTDNELSYNYSTIGTSSGFGLVNEKTQTGLSVMAPMYSRYTMLDTTPNSRTEGRTNVTVTDSLDHDVLLPEKTVASANEYIAWKYMFNVGTDYSLVYFLNVPSFFEYIGTITPTP